MTIIKSSMTSIEKTENGSVIVQYIEGACDSSESKPTAFIADGSIITETNTGDVYMFNAKTSAWVKMFGLKA